MNRAAAHAPTAGDCWAIVPARSGSSGFPGKNVALLDGAPLLAHSIRFAGRLSFVSDTLLLTDSTTYAEVGRAYGATIPYLRTAMSSSATSMEEDVLEELAVELGRQGRQAPKALLWLRPTHPLRSVRIFEEAWTLYATGRYTAVCVVTAEDRRVFRANGDVLVPPEEWPTGRSMARRQEFPPGYRIFAGEIFPFPPRREPNFLGNRMGFVVAPPDCRVDIDSGDDLRILNEVIASESGRARLSGYLHAAGQDPAVVVRAGTDRPGS